MQDCQRAATPRLTLTAVGHGLPKVSARKSIPAATFKSAKNYGRVCMLRVQRICQTAAQHNGAGPQPKGVG
jgi:hypothetical protein